MDEHIYAVLKNNEKESDFPGFAQACAKWSDEPTGKKVVKLDPQGKILEEFDAEECKEAARIFKESLPEKRAPAPPVTAVATQENPSAGKQEKS